MHIPLFISVSEALILALLFPAITGLAHRPYGHQHWYELRDRTQNTTQNSKNIPPLVIDTFQNPTHNDLGFWHGTGENLTVQHQPGSVRLFPTDPDQNFHTQFDTHGCYSLLPWQNQFLHVVFEGTDQFSVSLNEHNAECNPRRSPFPSVPDSVQASRYVMESRSGITTGDGTVVDDHHAASAARRKKKHPEIQRLHDSCDCDDDEGDDEDEDEDDDDFDPAVPGKSELFIPLSHFQINQDRVVSVSFTGFYTNEPVTLHRVEIVPTVPPPSPENNHFRIPDKLPSGTLLLRCSRPNSFAFGIDDGQPRFAQEVMRILDEEDVRVTFFVVGAGLSDPSTNSSNFYREMLTKGHQIALHSNTHPKMEALPTLAQIDDEIIQSKQVFKGQLGIESSYFRPPYGTVGARLRQQLARNIPNPYIVNWSVDVEDWLWANSSTPEKQLEAFYRSVARGGNLAVMHFLNPTTVGYLPQFIRHVKSVGFSIMRIDQCMEDPNSPPL